MGASFYEITDREMKLYKQESVIDTIILRMPPNDNLPIILDLSSFKYEVVLHVMGRIVDVTSFLQQYPFPKELRTDILLHVTDSFLDWNNGTFQLLINENGVSVTKKEIEVTNHNTPFLSCDIGTLTTMLLGYQTPDVLIELGRIRTNSDEALRFLRSMAIRTPYIVDSF